MKYIRRYSLDSLKYDMYDNYIFIPIYFAAKASI